MAQAGNSNTITRNYLDSLLIETRYMNSTNSDTTFTLYGETFASPIMTAALSHLTQIAEGGMAEGIARGALDAGCVMWYGAVYKQGYYLQEDPARGISGTYGGRNRH